MINNLENFEQNFRDIEQTLDKTSHLLENEYHNFEKNGGINVIQLIQRIQILRDSLPIIQEDFNTIYEEREVITNELGDILNENTNLITKIRQETGHLPKEINNDENMNNNENTNNEKKKKKKNGTPTDISKELFESVDESIRGRAKYNDVRNVYKTIVKDYREKKKQCIKGTKPDPITKRELGSKGLKVTGLTGESVLRTLSSLNMIKVKRDQIILITKSKKPLTDAN